jgi:transcriptional regulator with XRE-family HTH domain
MARPSDPLLSLIRDLAQRKGLNTAALAEQTGLDRRRLKKVLGGGDPMTVDELIQISEGLEIDAQALTQLQKAPTSPEETEPAPEEEPQEGQNEACLASDFDRSAVDPYGNHAEQVLRVAFELGCDIFCHLDSSLIGNSGIPESVQSRFPDFLPLRLEAAYHHQNRPVYKPGGLQLMLSFDSIYTCTLPWECFQQITLFPIRWDPTGEKLLEDNAEPAEPVPHLRLVD